MRGKKTHIIMIDSTYFKVHWTAASLRCDAGELGRLIGRQKADGALSCMVYVTGKDASSHISRSLIAVANCA